MPLDLLLDNEVALRLSEASLAIGSLHGACLNLPGARRLARPFLRREAELSSRIEGTKATQDELLLFEVDRPAAPIEPDIREVYNYTAALEHGVKRMKELPVSLRLIRELHAKLLRGVPRASGPVGEFRKRQNFIGAPGAAIGEARYVPPPPEDLSGCLDDFEKRLHAESKLPHLVRLAMIHYQFEAIHPFEDGNGRIGRLLLPLLMAEWKLLPTPLLYFSAFFEANRRLYYDSLLGVSLRGDWLAWIKVFLLAVTSVTNETLERALALFALREEYLHEIQKARTSAMLVRLVEELFSTPMITVPRVAKSFKLQYRSAQLLVERLEREGIVREITGRRRNRIYLAKKIQQIISAPSQPVS
jgi:Fic family protein